MLHPALEHTLKFCCKVVVVMHLLQSTVEILGERQPPSAAENLVVCRPVFLGSSLAPAFVGQRNVDTLAFKPQFIWITYFKTNLLDACSMGVVTVLHDNWLCSLQNHGSSKLATGSLHPIQPSTLELWLSWKTLFIETGYIRWSHSHSITPLTCLTLTLLATLTSFFYGTFFDSLAGCCRLHAA